MSRTSLVATLALGVALVLAGCGDPLDSRYGVTTPGSINGCAVLHDVFKARTNLRDAEVIGPRLEENGELLIHVARSHHLPDAAACDWLEGWLTEKGTLRQAVLILRAGNLTPWLCRRWAAQARSEAQRGGVDAPALEALGKQLERRADAEDMPLEFISDDSCSLFSVKRQTPGIPTAITGLALERLPQAMRVTGAFQVGDWPEPVKPGEKKPAENKSAEKKSTSDKTTKRRNTVEEDYDVIDHGASARAKVVVEPLITLSAPHDAYGGTAVEGITEQVAWAIAIPYGASRLVVVLDALPLLDGAQPDSAARHLLGALVDQVMEFHGEAPHTTWVKHLRVRGDGGPPNPMLAILTSAPVSYMSWHFVAFLVVLALAGAAWLGRREAPVETRHDRFSRHVLALAGRLRDGRHAAWCARAIARACLRHRQPPPALLDEHDARRWLASLTDTPTTPPASPRGSHDHRNSSDA